MISILSIGSSRPDRKLGALSYSTLSARYVSETGNAAIAEAVKNTVISTTELGYRAALIAIEKAGLVKEQVGLVLADCSTPLETIPGESQRVACMLGLKVPAYDITSGSTALVNFLSSLKSWKADRLPEYILCLSTNSPTQRLNFAASGEQDLFSDAAGAMIISARHSGRLVLKAIDDFRQTSSKGALEIDLFGHLKVDQEKALKNWEACGVKLDEKLKSLGVGNIKVLADRFPGASERSGVLYPSQSNSLGAGLICCLAENWDNLRVSDTILLYSVCLEHMGGALIHMECVA